MKNVKSRNWACLTDVHLEDWMQITTKIKPNIKDYSNKSNVRYGISLISLNNFLLKKIIGPYMNLCPVITQ